ncbi:hypothetical protein E4T49_06931 [Aureobasidium sp. EXF-10728]|nr:hypothetical protein E4T49_06931 [Aureobasidium sp. EXF-10728]
MELGRCKSISSSGFAGPAGPSTWEKVLEDESSSIYSRRPSMALESPLEAPMEHSSDIPEKTIGGDVIATNVSELTNRGKENTIGQAERVISASTGISFVASGSASHSDLRDSASVSGSAFFASSIPKSDSSGSLGKLSKFREDLNDSSTVPKPGEKRRSVLRILFPKLTKSKLRSTSTPLLGKRTPSSLNQTYDGTRDSQDLFQRSVSFVDKTVTRPASALSTGSLAVSPSLQSRQSLVNYERSLSIVGNNRRRKSTLGGPKIQAQGHEHQDDYPERTLHRASPLLSPGRKGTEETLMERALLQHQAEKAALLRPSSQRNEIVPSPMYAPVFTSPFGFQSTSETRLAAATLEDVDPLEPEEPQAARGSQGMQGLGSSENTVADASSFRKKKRSTVWTTNTTTTKGSKSHLHTTTPPRSWSRFPSHTREKRCSSAGRHDGIISRDFAHVSSPRTVHQTASLEEMATSPKSWPRLVNAKRRNWIVKSRSMTFGTVFRYYSNLLTSSAARNRRSSTATGGRLEHPELEVLPPMLPTHPTSSQRLGAKDQLARLVNHVEEEGHHIGNEGLGFIHRHRQESTSSLDKSPSGHDPPVPCMYDASQIVHDQEAGDLGPRDYTKDKSILPGSVDGNIEGRPAEPDRALSARKLSRMYQAYVQLPVSSENTEVEQGGATDDVGQVSDGPTTVESAEIDPKTPNTGLLAVPSGKQAVSSGSITRHFPSVTVVDDRKGHWRSVSLLSVDSGKSVRKSTRDLLEVVRATQTQELEKLLGTSELSMMDENTL